MNTNVVRAGAVAAVLGGLYLLVLALFQAFGNGDIDRFPLVIYTIPLMPVMLLAGAVGLVVLANGRRGLQAGAVAVALGAIFMAVGFALMAWLDNDNGWQIMFWGMVIHPVGILLFGVTNRPAQVLPRWNRVPLILGSTATALILAGILELWPESVNDSLFAVFLLLLALNWLVIGSALLSGIPKAADQGALANRGVSG